MSGQQQQVQQQQQQGEQLPLVKISTISSCQAPIPVEHAWDRLRDFGNADWASGIDLGGRYISVKAYMLESVPGSTVGAHRQIAIGQRVMVERLVAFDDYQHTMRWSTVTHATNTNPFPGAYVDSVVTLKLKQVTMGNTTVIALSNTFLTEGHNKEVMEATFQRLYDSAVVAMQRWLCRHHLLCSG